MTDAPTVFQKVTTATAQIAEDGTQLVFQKVDYIAAGHVLAYVLHANSTGFIVQAVEADDRPADADRTYNPPAYLTEGSPA